MCYFARFLGSDIDIDLVNAGDLRRFITALQGKKAFSNHPFTATQNRPLSPHTVASYTRAIRCFFAFLEREEILPANPMKKVRVPKTPRRVMPTFTEAELERLLAQPDRTKCEGYRNYAVMLTLLDTGIRVSELCGLTLEEVDLDNGYLRVLGKGAKERSVYMCPNVSKTVYTYVYRWRPKTVSAHVFIHADGRPLNRIYMAHRLRKYAKRAKIYGVRCSPHTLRHTFAIEYLRNGGDVFTLQRILGHSTLEMTRRYAEVANRDIELKQKALSPAESLTLNLEEINESARR